MNKAIVALLTLLTLLAPLGLIAPVAKAGAGRNDPIIVKITNARPGGYNDPLLEQVLFGATQFVTERPGNQIKIIAEKYDYNDGKEFVIWVAASKKVGHSILSIAVTQHDRAGGELIYANNAVFEITPANADMTSADIGRIIIYYTRLLLY